MPGRPRTNCTSDLISFRPLLLGSPRRNRELPSAAPTIALRHALDLVAPRFTLSTSCSDRAASGCAEGVLAAERFAHPRTITELKGPRQGGGLRNECRAHCLGF